VNKSRAVLVYDGDCGFCLKTANWISRKWPEGDLALVVPWQSLTSEMTRAPLPNADDLKSAAWWIEMDRQESGSRAVAHALLAANAPWSLLGRLLLTPPVSWIARQGYRVVARYRYRLPGGTPACKI